MPVKVSVLEQVIKYEYSKHNINNMMLTVPVTTVYSDNGYPWTYYHELW